MPRFECVLFVVSCSDDDDDDDDDELREKVVFVLVHYIRDSLKFVGLVTGAAELEQLEHAEVE